MGLFIQTFHDYTCNEKHMNTLTSYLTPLVEAGYVPDSIVRLGVRQLLQGRLDEQNQGDVVKQMQHKQEFIAHLKTQPLALSTDEANEQHYEVPTAFYLNCLDQKYLKYSACYFGYEAIDSR